jgi:hypothetical protein
MYASASKTVILGLLVLVAMAGMMNEFQANASPMPDSNNASSDVPAQGMAHETPGQLIQQEPINTPSEPELAPEPAPAPAPEKKPKEKPEKHTFGSHKLM